MRSVTEEESETQAGEKEETTGEKNWLGRTMELWMRNKAAAVELLSEPGHDGIS